MKQTIDKATPASIEAERAVLGSCLIDPEAYMKASRLVAPGQFMRETHGWIFSAMEALQAKAQPTSDWLLITEQLEKQGHGADLDPGYLTGLIAETPTALYVEHYADIVRTNAVRRGLITAAGKIAGLAYDETSSDDTLMDMAQKALLAISGGTAKAELQPLSATIQATIEAMDERGRLQRIPGVPTGFTMLDRMLGGLQKSDLIILGARPGMGKTSLVLSMAQHAAKKNERVAFFSLEMSTDQLNQRLLSMETGIDVSRLRNSRDLHEDEWPIILHHANILSKLPFHIDDTPGQSVGLLANKARRLYMQGGLDLIIIDYIQLMSGAGGSGYGQENRQQEISFISRSLKNLARELNVPVVVLSQLGRAVESRADKRPMMSDLKESGAIEQDADVVMMIYREDYYIEDSDRQNIADILITKHRHGATGTVSLYFRKELTQFRDLEIERTELEY